jgi:hypothetical protein
MAKEINKERSIAYIESISRGDYFMHDLTRIMANENILNKNI